MTFEWKETDETGKVTKSKVTVAEYLVKRWGDKLKTPLRQEEYNQPLLMLSQRGQPIYLLPSRCHEASLPKDFTKDANKMKDLRNYMITDPTIRYNRIGDLTATVFSQAKVLNDWNLKVNQNFAQIKAKQLYHCKVLDPKNNQRSWEDYEGRRFHHAQPLILEKDKWALVYTGRDFDAANNVVQTMGKAGGAFGVRIDEPQWVEVPSNKASDFVNAIKASINPKNTKIIFVIIPRPEEKKAVKAFLDKGGIPSQFMTSFKAQKMSLAVASNVVKQMNAKTQGDLYRISLPSFKNTMLVGVDVIMNGSSKLIGCSATNSNTLTQCYTKLYKHKMPRPQASDIGPG